MTPAHAMLDVSPSAQLSFPLIEEDARMREARAAKSDPSARRETRVFDEGVPARYRHVAVHVRRGREVRFCWSVHPNAAGYFLIWRETITSRGGVRKIVRDQWDSTIRKREAVHTCWRLRAAFEAQLKGAQS